MNRNTTLLLAPLLAVSLTLPGCGLAPLAAILSGGSTPAPQAVQNATAPLVGTHIDEQALRVALTGFDTVLYAVDALVAAHVLVRNSPRALTVRRFLVATRDALNAAFDIAMTLNSPVQTLSAAEIAAKAAEYRRLLAQAETAFNSAKSAIRGESASLDRAFDVLDRNMGDLTAGRDLSEIDVRRAEEGALALRRVIVLERDLRLAGLIPAGAGAARGR